MLRQIARKGAPSGTATASEAAPETAAALRSLVASMYQRIGSLQELAKNAGDPFVVLDMRDEVNRLRSELSGLERRVLEVEHAEDAAWKSGRERQRIIALSAYLEALRKYRDVLEPAARMNRSVANLFDAVQTLGGGVDAIGFAVEMHREAVDGVIRGIERELRKVNGG